MACQLCGNQWTHQSLSAVVGYTGYFEQETCKCGWASSCSNGDYKIIDRQPLHPTMPGAYSARVVEDMIGKAEAAMQAYADTVNPKSEGES